MKDSHVKYEKTFPLESSVHKQMKTINSSGFHEDNMNSRKLGCISIHKIQSDIVLYVQNAQENLDSYLFPSIIELICFYFLNILIKNYRHE